MSKKIKKIKNKKDKIEGSIECQDGDYYQDLFSQHLFLLKLVFKKEEEDNIGSIDNILETQKIFHKLQLSINNQSIIHIL